MSSSFPQGISSLVFEFLAYLNTPFPMEFASPQLKSQSQRSQYVRIIPLLWRDGWAEFKCAFVRSVSVVNRSSNILSDIIILVLTWTKTYGIKKAAAQAGLRTSLSTLILRDGTLYFGVRVIIDVVSILTTFVLPLTSTPSGVLLTPSDLSTGSINFNFATSITANMGAPLDHSSWDDSADPINATLEQQIENPLSIGILDVPLIEHSSERFTDSEVSQVRSPSLTTDV
ncbi:hypothetical protein NLI96_g9926 [Meripilus lineatus]|uniref:Uncharacterized protein n=1 Tax=Meripilus lineatus TaxID=2056292 RepID=A0AAD5UUJ7_9APHY|nr:hypothetical protein NLI96_g9926 [Physisporinus lineatus]